MCGAIQWIPIIFSGTAGIFIILTAYSLAAPFV